MISMDQTTLIYCVGDIFKCIFWNNDIGILKRNLIEMCPEKFNSLRPSDAYMSQ